jgi:hypothetical protein
LPGLIPMDAHPANVGSVQNLLLAFYPNFTTSSMKMLTTRRPQNSTISRHSSAA